MAVVLENKRLAEGTHLLTLSGAAPGCAGQFYILRAASGYDPFLGRPVSLCLADEQAGTVSFFIQTVGRGTAQLCALLPGQTIEAQGPYGNGYPLEHGRAVLVGGGAGIAPLLQLAKSLRGSEASRIIDVYLGFRETPLLTDAFERYADAVSVDVGGFVTDKADFSLAATYYACGPAPMLRAAATRAAKADARLYVSLEKRMACGVGACLGCTCQTAHGAKRVCKDGPVFDYREVPDVL